MVQFPAPAGLEGEEGDGAMACNPRPCTGTVEGQRDGEEKEKGGGGGAREEMERARVRGGVAGALVGARGQVERGPRRAVAAPLPFGVVAR